MSALLQHVPEWLHLGHASIALLLCLPCLGFLDAFGDKSQKTNVTNSDYQNSFNTSSSEISSVDGSTNISLGGGESAAAGGTSQIVVVAFASILVIAGLYLLTRRK